MGMCVRACPPKEGLFGGRILAPIVRGGPKGSGWNLLPLPSGHQIPFIESNVANQISAEEKKIPMVFATNALFFSILKR